LVGSLVILVTYYLLMTSLEGAALGTRIPAWLGIWTPNILFATVGLGLLIATTREWKWRAMPRGWRVLQSGWRPLRIAHVWSLRPRGRGIGGARDSTHIIDRYLLREYVIFIAIGLAVAATLFVMIDLLQTLDRYLRTKPPLMYIFEHFAYRVPVA